MPGLFAPNPAEAQPAVLVFGTVAVDDPQRTVESVRLTEHAEHVLRRNTDNADVVLDQRIDSAAFPGLAVHRLHVRLDSRRSKMTDVLGVRRRSEEHKSELP